MMHREEFLKKHPNIKGSMIAYDEKGDKLGKVTTLFEDGLNIEKGLFFPRDYSASYDDVVEVRDTELIINLHGRPAGDKAYEARAEGAREPGAESSFWAGRIDDLNRGGEIEIPLMEEDLRVQKTEDQRSEVHLRKFVHTEDKTMTIPVKSEELVIEHARPSGSADPAATGEMAFTEEDITIPLMEERVEVLKSQHVRETVHLKKESHMENQEVKGTVRIEDVEVKTEDKEAIKEKRGF